MKMNIGVLSRLVALLCIVQCSWAADSVCAEYKIQNISICKDASTWAEGTPNVTVTHRINPAPEPTFNVGYDLVLKNTTKSSLCYFQLSSTSCSILAPPLPGDKCVCQNKIASDDSVLLQVVVIDMQSSKQESTIRYTLTKSGIDNRILHTFTLTECSLNITNAEVVNISNTPCGYDCTAQISCIEGYQDLGASSLIYQCNAAGNWTPNPPECTKIMPEPTTTETATTPTTPTTSNGSTQGASTTHYSTTAGSTTSGDVGISPNSGLILAVIGGLLAAICIGHFVYMAVYEIPNNVVLYAMFALCVCIWAIALGLCFGLSTNKSAVIAGIVLGSLALAGMVVVIVFLFLHKKSHTRKGIPGKPEDPSL